MSDHPFQLVEETVLAGGAEESFDLLARRFREQKNYPQLFETRLMKRRHQLGLPLIQPESLADLPDETRKAYDDGCIEAAREVGRLFLEDGDIVRAWPYFRAIGEPGPVAAAIEKAQPGDGIEPVIEIAFLEGVHPYKGFSLILAHHGICRAISCVDQYPARTGRQDCIRLLVRTLHAELVDRLRQTIAQNEPTAPETNRVSELIEGRDWLFGEYTYYVDTSHLVSVIRYSLELDDRESLSFALELTGYGSRLSTQFQYKGEPPFEDIYRDGGLYLRALLGEQVDEAVNHFRAKAAQADPEMDGTFPAEVLIGLLARLKRYPEAIEASLAHLPQQGAARLSCPSVLQLCQMAGDFGKLRELARERQDLLSYAAALLGERRLGQAHPGAGV